MYLNLNELRIKQQTEVNMNSRRLFLQSAAALSAATLLPLQTAYAEVKKLLKSKQEWRDLLNEQQFHVMFEEGTERAGTSPLNAEKRDGTFVCAACNQPLFTAETKYESGTGWPSFFRPIEGAIATKTDYKLIWPRTEYHCARCGAHQGHVFTDGPQPTGKRYCNNGVALQFVEEGQALPELRQ